MNDKNFIKGNVFRFGDNINTDIIISGKYLRTEDSEIFKMHAFESTRGENFYKQVKKGDVLIAMDNFGCGSSREQAALAIKELGFAILIAVSFGRIFYRNIVNLGIPAVTIEESTENIAFFNQIEENDSVEIDMSNSVLKVLNKNINIKFQPLSPFMQKLIDSGGLLNYARYNSSNTR